MRGLFHNYNCSGFVDLKKILMTEMCDFGWVGGGGGGGGREE